MTKMITTPNGETLYVEPVKPIRLSEVSKSRIIEALACSTVSFADSVKACPSLRELADSVAQKNETAASELGLLGDYRFAVHCMTN